MKLKTFGQTDVGKKRDHNEDTIFMDEDVDLYVVADGMGGHAAGEVATDVLTPEHDAQQQADESPRGDLHVFPSSRLVPSPPRPTAVIRSGGIGSGGPPDSPELNRENVSNSLWVLRTAGSTVEKEMLARRKYGQGPY